MNIFDILLLFTFVNLVIALLPIDLKLPKKCLSVTCNSEDSSSLPPLATPFGTPQLSTKEKSRCAQGKCKGDSKIDCLKRRCPTETRNSVCCNRQFYPNTCQAKCFGGVQDVDGECTPGQCSPPPTPTPTPTTPPAPLELPFCSDTANCFVDPCQISQCPSFPEAVCLSNQCLSSFEFLGTLISSGACTAVWVDPSQPSVIPQDQC